MMVTGMPINIKSFNSSIKSGEGPSAGIELLAAQHAPRGLPRNPRKRLFATCV